MKNDKGCNVTKLYDEVLDTLRQRIQSFKNLCVLSLAAYLSQLSFRSNRLSVRKQLT
jgi:hypothetical protein